MTVFIIIKWIINLRASTNHSPANEIEKMPIKLVITIICMTINLYINTITMTALIPPFLCLPSASVTTQLSKLLSAMLN